MKDSIVAEVRKHRAQHAAKFGGDLKLICEDLRRIEATVAERVVQPKTRKSSRRKKA